MEKYLVVKHGTLIPPQKKPDDIDGPVALSPCKVKGLTWFNYEATLKQNHLVEYSTRN